MVVRSRRSLLRTLGLALPLLAGCGPVPPSPEGEGGLATQADEVRIANSLTTQALLFNAISTNAQANALVATSALGTAFASVGGNAYLREQLKDVDAQHFMKYLVGCALGPSQSVTWNDPLTQTVKQWEGISGLCPEWATQAPNGECLRRVSACILARNNAFGRRVELSLRGEDPRDANKFALEAVTVPTEYDPDTSARVASFEPCTEGERGASRDCGWSVDALGRCVPGQTVRLGAGGRAPDMCEGAQLGTTPSGRSVLRVCEGLAGCNSEGQRVLAGSEGSCGDEAPAVAFTCPSSGNFNVMLAPWDSAASTLAVVGVEEHTNTTYRLSEQTAFRYREGAFYGTLFDASALAANVYVEKGVVYGKRQRVRGSVYRKMFSCYDPAWQRGAAYATYRVCALPSADPENCAATVAGPCWDGEPKRSMCAQQDGNNVRLGDGDYEGCRDTEGATWKEPVTTFLHGRCDLVPSGMADLCLRRQ